MKKKRKDIPFHIVHNYKHWELGEEGPKFWARDEDAAKLYCKKIEWSPTALIEIGVADVKNGRSWINSNIKRNS